MKTRLEAIEPALSYARDRLMAGTGATPSETAIAALGEALSALRACHGFLAVHRPPVYRTERAGALVSSCYPDGANERIVTRIESVGDCVYDAEQVRACVEAVVGSVRLEDDARLWVELFEEEDVPRVAVSLDGPGRVPDTVSFGGFVELPFEEFEARWTVATRGGRIDKTTNGLALRLKGIRDPRESVEGLQPLIDAVAGAEKNARTALRWIGIAAEGSRQADSAKECGKALEAARGALDGALLIVEGAPAPLEPADLTSVLAEVEKELRPGLEHAGIHIETLCDAQTPPILMHRRSMSAFFRSLFGWGKKGLPDGGLVSLLMEYDLPRHSVGLVISFTGPTAAKDGAFYEASLRRALVEKHGGTLECSSDAKSITISASVPDPVGKTLEEWIPGFAVYSVRSKKMLRLLKGSGQAALEEAIMGGVLEEELERWLLPRLEDPMTIHLARDLKPDNRALPGSSPERLEKALGQVQRGKPRKEICKPQYAGELLWAFRIDERHRAALGLNGLNDAAIKALCIALVQSPPACLEALRIIAKVGYAGRG
ncbi:MAG: hypothetical protein HZB26_03320 [Candidatus Hydrogenedentes bacterium]|nr:hypothetical protein [Candidatus Hydrogenedentota bacterium]